MWELDYKESWVPKHWCFWTMVLEKTLESPLDSNEMKPANTKGNQSWIFIGRTDAEAETPILWLPDTKRQLIGKNPDAGKDKAGGEGDDREWDGWMASPAWRTGGWAISRSWWWTGKPGVLQSMGLQRVGHNWATVLNCLKSQVGLFQSIHWLGFSQFIWPNTLWLSSCTKVLDTTWYPKVKKCNFTLFIIFPPMLHLTTEQLSIHLTYD